jgi:fructose transport system substrate-binding protein
MTIQLNRRSARRGLTAAIGLTTCLTMVAACGGDEGGGEGGGGDGGAAVTLITKDSTNPFFVAMQEGAREAAEAEGVDLSVESGAQDGDEAGQIDAIENAIASGDDGILITPNGPGVNAAIEDARNQGLYVIALDTPTDPPDIVDITFATDNFKAGELTGSWAAAQLDGEKATIALLDLFNDQVVSVDYNRDQGFLTGMGIDTADPKVNGDEAPSGEYSGGQYEIVCNEPTGGNGEGGKTAMENCLAQNPDINVVYSINEPSGAGAYEALEAAGKQDQAIIVSVDGGCEGVRQVEQGIIDATAQQYPLDMAKLGVEEIKSIADGNDPREPTEGLDFYDTGVALVTDKPADGVESIDTAEGLDLCWGE